MDRVFNAERAAWKISFDFIFRDLDHLDDYFVDIADVVSSYAITSQSIAPQPEDLWRFEAYFTTAPRLSNIMESLRIRCNHEYILQLEKIEDKDWVLEAQQNFTPIITRDYFIASDYYSDHCPENKKLVVINPGRAFGTGDHATTQSCIESLYALKNHTFKKIADIGCGTGVLAIIAAQYWPDASISGCDIEEIAAKIANNNALINHSVIKFQYADAKNYLESGDQYDLIIANILAKPLIDISSKIYNALCSEGFVILSGFLTTQLQQILDHYLALGFVKYQVIEDDGWISLTLKK